MNAPAFDQPAAGSRQDIHPELPDALQDALHDVLVIGGGLSGSALAISLAASGRSVLLVEKSAAAHPKVCGEFLSHEALHYLARLGVDAEQLGAVAIDRVRLASHSLLAEARLPFRSLSLSRERLDEALLARAGELGVRIVRGQRISSLARQGNAWMAKTSGGRAFHAASAFLATGKHDLHGWNRPSAGLQNDLLAFKMYWRLATAQQVSLADAVELVLFPGGYAGLQPVEGGRANLCLLVRGQVYRELGGSWPALLAYLERHSRYLAERLQGASACWQRPLSLSAIPYGYLRSRAEDGAWRLGDQSAVIPSFSGDGMSIALHSGCLAATMYLDGAGADAFQKRLASHLSRQVGIAAMLSRALIAPRRASALSVVASYWPGVLAHVAVGTRITSRHLLA